MPASDTTPLRRPAAPWRLARTALSVATVALLVPLLSFASIARALYLRIVRGKASGILRVHQGRYRAGVFYGAQLVFDKPFDPSRLREVFFEMVEERESIESRRDWISSRRRREPFPRAERPKRTITWSRGPIG
jgi:hypothetical protein